MIKRLACAYCFLILTLLCNYYSYSEEAGQMELSLQDCISMALESNLTLRIQRISPQIQETFVTSAKGRFDPVASMGPRISRMVEPSISSSSDEIVKSESDSESVGIGFSDPLSTGGNYGLFFNSSRFENTPGFQSINPTYRSGLSLSFNQPLLDGFGFGVNKASTKIASNNRDVSILTLKSRLIQTTTSVQNAYWELVFALENLKVQQLSLKQAKDLLAINSKSKELGKASISDVLQAQAAVASREADVIAASDLVRDAEDNLKRITNIMEDESRWDAEIIPVDKPSITLVNMDLQEAANIALAKRPEYQQTKLDVENSNISLKVAKNSRLPVLDLEGSFDLNGLGGDAGEPLSQVGKADYRSWSLALAFRMPLGQRVEKAELRKRQFEVEQKLLALKDMEQNIITEVRGAIRQIETDKKRIEATKAAEELAQQVLTTEEKKHQLGLSTSYELIQFQANLATAARNRLRAMIDYRKSIVYLYQVLGTMLEELNIELEQ